MKKTCADCKKQVEEWNEKCGGCGFTLVIEPDEKRRARYLRGPSLGALLWTQGWTFGARLYLWFLLSLIPIVGFVALFACLLCLFLSFWPLSPMVAPPYLAFIWPLQNA